jgi:hypothetical protein
LRHTVAFCTAFCVTRLEGVFSFCFDIENQSQKTAGGPNIAS